MLSGASRIYADLITKLQVDWKVSIDWFFPLNTSRYNANPFNSCCPVGKIPDIEAAELTSHDPPWTGSDTWTDGLLEDSPKDELSGIPNILQEAASWKDPQAQLRPQFLSNWCSVFDPEFLSFLTLVRVSMSTIGHLRAGASRRCGTGALQKPRSTGRIWGLEPQVCALAPSESIVPPLPYMMNVGELLVAQLIRLCHQSRGFHLREAGIA